MVNRSGMVAQRAYREPGSSLCIHSCLEGNYKVCYKVCKLSSFEPGSIGLHDHADQKTQDFIPSEVGQQLLINIILKQVVAIVILHSIVKRCVHAPCMRPLPQSASQALDTMPSDQNNKEEDNNSGDGRACNGFHVEGYKSVGW